MSPSPTQTPKSRPAPSESDPPSQSKRPRLSKEEPFGTVSIPLPSRPSSSTTAGLSSVSLLPPIEIDSGEQPETQIRRLVNAAIEEHSKEIAEKGIVRYVSEHSGDGIPAPDVEVHEHMGSRSNDLAKSPTHSQVHQAVSQALAEKRHKDALRGISTWPDDLANYTPDQIVTFERTERAVIETLVLEQMVNAELQEEEDGTGGEKARDHQKQAVYANNDGSGTPLLPKEMQNRTQQRGNANQPALKSPNNNEATTNQSQPSPSPPPSQPPSPFPPYKYSGATTSHRNALLLSHDPSTAKTTAAHHLRRARQELKLLQEKKGDTRVVVVHGEHDEEDAEFVDVLGVFDGEDGRDDRVEEAVWNENGGRIDGGGVVVPPTEGDGQVKLVLDPGLEGAGKDDGDEGSAAKSDGGGVAGGEEGVVGWNLMNPDSRSDGSEEEKQDRRGKNTDKEAQKKGEKQGQSKTEDRKDELHGKQDWEFPTNEWGMGSLNSMGGGIGRFREGVSDIIDDSKSDTEE